MILSCSKWLSIGLSPGKIWTKEAMSHLMEAVFVIGIDLGPFIVSVFTTWEERALSIDLAVLGAQGSGPKWDADA